MSDNLKPCKENKLNINKNGKDKKMKSWSTEKDINIK